MRAANGTAAAFQLPPAPRVVTQTNPRALHSGKTALVKTSTVVNYIASELEIDAQRLAVIKAKLSKEVTSKTASLMQRVSPQAERFTLSNQRKLILKKLGMRTAVDRKFLLDFDHKTRMLAAVLKHAALLQAQISRLTLVTAPTWKPAPFPEV